MLRTMNKLSQFPGAAAEARANAEWGCPKCRWGATHVPGEAAAVGDEGWLKGGWTHPPPWYVDELIMHGEASMHG